MASVSKTYPSRASSAAFYTQNVRDRPHSTPKPILIAPHVGTNLCVIKQSRYCSGRVHWLVVAAVDEADHRMLIAFEQEAQQTRRGRPSPPWDHIESIQSVSETRWNTRRPKVRTYGLPSPLTRFLLILEPRPLAAPRSPCTHLLLSLSSAYC